MIIVVDYDMGNLGSVLNMLKKIGAKASLSADPRIIEAADRIILPGVGAFDTGMRNLEEKGLLESLHRAAEKGTPILGICLGMHLLMERSEEGTLPGLGWIKGSVDRFRFIPSETGLKIPHMGWNTFAIRRDDAIVANLDGDARFYFVHSYYVNCADPSDIVAATDHGESFSSVIRRGNISGMQFHPEKSHRFGMALLANFAEMV